MPVPGLSSSIRSTPAGRALTALALAVAALAAQASAAGAVTGLLASTVRAGR